jgi:glycosyltransferase involved in cell wall biosynthesis
MNKSNFSDHMIKTPKAHQGDRRDLSVIVPCYNEADHLMSMAEGLSPYLDSVVGTSRWQYVIVSNGSTDNTPEVMAMIAERWPFSLLLRLKRPDYGRALREGLRKAEGKWAFLINVDFWDHLFLSWAWQHRNMYDLFIGSKRADPYLDKRPRYRKILSWGLNALLQVYFGLVATDTHGQKLLSLEPLDPVLHACVMNRGQYDTEFTLRSQRSGLRIAELPVPITETRKQRNLMLKKIIQNLIDIIKLKQIMKRVPTSGGIHYHRYSRLDMESQVNSSAARRKMSYQD